MRYAIVREGKVEQIVLWDGSSSWSPPKGTQAVEATDTTQIGATYDGRVFTNPAPTPSGQAERVGADNLTDTERATLKALVAKMSG